MWVRDHRRWLSLFGLICVASTLPCATSPAADSVKDEFVLGIRCAELTDQQRRRRRSLTDIAVEAMNRGDQVILARGETRHRGVLVSVHSDLAVLSTGMGLVNTRLPGTTITIAERAPAGGTHGDRGSQTFRGRLAELEHTTESIIIEGPDLELHGRIVVASEDHVSIVDAERREWFVPYEEIWFVIQPRG